MPFNRAAFFSAVRSTPFAGTLIQGQVDGLEAILREWENRKPDGDVRWLAYMLATAFHETARTMEPIKERGGAAYFKRMYDIEGERPKVARTLGNTLPGDGVKYCGRGYVQLTGRANYAKAGAKLRADFLGNPDGVMRADLAAAIMFAGMEEGWFTGKKLANYFDTDTNDPVNARRIINGVDKADLIASYHRSFLAGLKGSQMPAGSPVEPTKPKAPKAPVPAAPSGLVAWLRRLFTKA